FTLYQQWLIKDREKAKCFQAFLNNNWFGLSIFIGIFVNYII
ncbi:MAG: 4-hydroxybenzoate octaprenyltransferase, partial [Methylococcales bacterium]